MLIENWLFLSSALIYVMLIGFIGSLERRFNREEARPLKIEDLTVIVPFRNEVDRIRPLLQSLKEQKMLPKMLFVDDHSTDSTDALIREVLLDGNYEIIKLTESKGKKFAVSEGISRAQTEFIITLDADVKLKDTYFENLEIGEGVDLCILPVRTIGIGGLSNFFAIDYNLMQWINQLSYLYRKAHTCSGANLLFKRSFYLETESKRKDMEILSGDDHFLLNQAYVEGRKVEMNTSPSLLVETNSSDSLMDNLSQRKRWFSKTQWLPDAWGKQVGLFSMLILLSVYLLWGYMSIVDPKYFLAFFLLNGFVLRRLSMLGKTEPMSLISAGSFLVVYPFYALIFLMSYPFLQVEWKDRPIKKPAK